MTSFSKFFDTFGYVVLRNLYDRALRADLQAAYDSAVTSYYGQTMEEYISGPLPPPPLINGVEMSAPLLNFLQTSRILPIVDELIGGDAVFIGSDLSTFRSASQFHRDAIGDFRLLKIGIYLQDSTQQDGGQFCCIPGSHHFGDRYAELCSQGLQWPRSAGYVDRCFTGEFDFGRGILQNNIPALGVDLAVGDAIFFNPALIHSVPASSRPRRMIAMTFFEGEQSFNSRPRPAGEFAGLDHTDTLLALKVAFYLFDVEHGRKPHLNYHHGLESQELGGLKKYLREFAHERFDEVRSRVFNDSYRSAYRFLTRADPA